VVVIVHQWVMSQEKIDWEILEFGHLEQAISSFWAEFLSRVQF